MTPATAPTAIGHSGLKRVRTIQAKVAANSTHADH
jgi:hypothetical protein